MQVIMIALSGGMLIYCILILFLSHNGAMIVRQRLETYFHTADTDEIQAMVLKESRRQARQNKRGGLHPVAKEFAGYLTAAGVRLSPLEYICAWLLSTLVPMFAVLFFSGSIITVAGVGIIGFSIPPLMVRRSRSRRQLEFNKQLGEALTVMGNCIRAGFTFQQAMESIAAEMQPPISTEFAKTLREMQYGISMEDALKRMVERVKNQDLDLLVSAVLTATQVGGNLSDILDVISETLRDRLRIQSEVRVLTSSGRTSGMIIGMLPIFIVIALMVINPDYFLSFLDSGAGKMLLGLSCVLEATGFAVINKIVNIKY